jgi:probable F420-dependent oxidoreductase
MGVRIGLGLADFPFSGAKAFWRWVELCEEETSIDSIWQSDRLVGQGPFLECLSLMAALAGATRRLKFGMNVLSLAFREPLIVAKQCASIDYLSDGRLLPAFGIGNFASPDWKAMGLEQDGQGRRANAALDIIARLWRGETVDVEGPHFRYAGARISPLPAQTSLPMWLGGSSPAAIRRTARYGTGWQSGLETPEEVAPVVQAIKAAAIEAGRPMDPEHFGAGFFYRFGSADDPMVETRRVALRKALPGRDLDKTIVVGGAAEIIRRVSEYQASGITKFVLRPLGQGDDDLMVQTRRLAEEVLPAFHPARGRATG